MKEQSWLRRLVGKGYIMLGCATLLLTVGAIVVNSVGTLSNHEHELRIAFPQYWNSVHPGLQHTIVGDLLLSNQFDSLVSVNDHGVLRPLAAESWRINDDFTLFEFHVRRDLVFSNGTALRASHFKSSWETALRLHPVSHNNSLGDLLYLVDGYENFKKTGHLSGITVDDAKNTIVIKFKAPFRMALDHLSGNRFSAFLTLDNGTNVGTGRYVVEELPERRVRLTPNAHHPLTQQLESIIVSTVFMQDLKSALQTDKLDVMAYGRGSGVDQELLNDSRFEIMPIEDATHEGFVVNGMPGHFFSREDRRLGLLSLIWEAASSQRLGPTASPLFTPDLQFFLPFQAGRLEQAAIDTLLNEAAQHRQALIKESKTRPIVVYVHESQKYLLEQLSSAGLSLSPLSRVLKPEEYYPAVYNSQDYDLFYVPFSVVNGDPDGLYHCFGSQGAIRAPTTNAPVTAALLESGRRLTQQSQLDEHYKNITRSLLRELPFIHLGFSKAVAIYRKDRVHVNAEELRRNQGHLHIFEPIR